MIYQKTGNPTPADEARVIELLERREVGQATPREVIELALLFYSPLYQEPEAISILSELVARDPGNEQAGLWLSFVYVRSEWRFGSSAIDSAIGILKSLIVSPDEELAAAARLVLYSALTASEWDGHKFGKALLPERISCLQESITLRPDWITNRGFLAWEYVEAKRYADALEQISAVRKNETLEPPVVSGLIDTRFESWITGRLSSSGNWLIGRCEAKIFRKRPDLAPAENK
jgi:hypothetical protein